MKILDKKQSSFSINNKKLHNEIYFHFTYKKSYANNFFVGIHIDTIAKIANNC